MSPNSDSILSQELSRRTALKALFGAASAAVLFGLPARARAAEATKETTDKLNAAQAQLDEDQAQLDSIASEYAARANKNAQTLSDIEGVQGQIDDTQTQIDEKKAELKKKRDDLSDRVSPSYKSGGTNILSLLLASGSFEEQVANAHYVEKINKSDRAAIEDIQTIQEELDAQKTELESQKADLEKLKDQQTAQMQDMQTKQQEVQAVLSGRSDDVKELMAQRDAEVLAATQAEEDRAKQPIVAGPWMYDSISDTEITLVPNPEYNGEYAAEDKKIQYSILPDPTARVTAQQEGSTLVMELVTADAVEQLENAGCKIDNVPGFGTRIIKINVAKEP